MIGHLWYNKTFQSIIVLRYQAGNMLFWCRYWHHGLICKKKFWQIEVIWIVTTRLQAKFSICPVYSLCLRKRWNIATILLSQCLCIMNNNTFFREKYLTRIFHLFLKLSIKLILYCKIYTKIICMHLFFRQSNWIELEIFKCFFCSY